MAIIKNVNRQEPALAHVTFTFGTGADIAAQGTFPALDLPQNAVVTRGHLVVSDATDAGVTVAVTGYLSASSAATTGIFPLVATGVELLAASTLNVVVAGATPVASGVATLVVEYYVNGKSEWSQG
jgi:hypothetical protein